MTEPVAEGPIKLVPKLRVEDKIQAEILKLLGIVTDLAKDGQVSCLAVILAHPDGTYSEVISSTLMFREMIGQLEVVKQNWIWNYLASIAGANKPTGGK